MTKLPHGWIEVRLDEVADVRLGRQRSPKNHSGPRMRPYLRAANVTWNGLDLRDVKEMNFTEEESRVYELQSGDVVVAEASGSASEVGKPALWHGEVPSCCLQNTLVRVRTRGPLPEYLRYFLLAEAVAGRIGHASPGVGIHHIGASRLSAWPTPIPPLAEQRRIVAAIEEQLSRLDAAEAQLRVARARLDSLRARIVDGSVREEWDRRPFSEVIERLRNGVFVSRPAAHPPGIPIFRISAVRALALNADDIRYADVEPGDVADYFVKEGDLLFTRYSGNASFVGACAAVPRSITPTLHPDKLIRVVLDRSRCVPEFIEIAFASRLVRCEVEARLKTTAGQVGIAGGQLRTIPVPLPSLDEQRRVVAQVWAVLSGAEALVRTLSAASVRAAGLRRAILARAFRGELVPQDPVNKPASALLERIAAERAASPPEPPRRKRVQSGR